MVASGLELVNLCETRIWNTQFHRKISNGKTGLPFQKFHFFRKFSGGTNRKIIFHLQPNRNFRNLLVNGKHPSCLGADQKAGGLWERDCKLCHLWRDFFIASATFFCLARFLLSGATLFSFATFFVWHDFFLSGATFFRWRDFFL